MLIQKCWHSDGKLRPKAGELLQEFRTLLDVSTNERCETNDKTLLYSSSHLDFKLRAMRQSFDEFMYDDRDEISQSLLMNCKTEKVLTAPPNGLI